MNWNRYINETLEKKQAFLILLVCILIIVSLLLNESLILLPAGFIGTWIIASWKISKQIGRKLEVDNPKRTIRLFEGETSEIIITLKNNSYLPYVNCFLSFITNLKIEGSKQMTTERMNRNLYRIPFILLGKSEIQLAIPFQAKERGIVRIKDIQLTFPHLLNFEDVVLTYTGFYHTEILIYPRPAAIQGIEKLPYYKFGDQLSRFSLFEDQINMIGMKDYEDSDPFSRIHWKASAKNQLLKTKVFERNIHISWTIIVNISSKSPLGNRYLSKNLEQYLSQAAYFCQTIIKQGYRLELCVNLKDVRSKPYHLEKGHGIDHMKKVIEFLARVEESGVIMNMDYLLHWVNQKNDSNLIAIIGELDPECNPFIQKWNRAGKKVYHIEEISEMGYLKEIKLERSNLSDVN